MLALGRALMAKPRLLLLDEPSLGLAPLIVREIFRIVMGLRELGVSILLVEQNVETALRLCPRVFLMEKGTVVYDGTAQELKAQPEIVHRYLGLSKPVRDPEKPAPDAIGGGHRFSDKITREGKSKTRQPLWER
jgi:branched-chain amino acid transport system ATP-binding protein